MLICINALSCKNLSGRQVLCGHLTEMLKQTPATHRFLLLVNEWNEDIWALMGEEWGEALLERVLLRRTPIWTAHWLGRTVYERLYLGRLAGRLGVERYLSLSGGWTRGIPCPQYTLALNPWALVDSGRRHVGERMKGALQRKTYRQAVFHADGIGYSSEYIRTLYRCNADRVERRSAIVYPALSARESAALDAVKRHIHDRDPHTVLCVSYMARHKELAVLLDAVRRVREGYRTPIRLRLVGPWADAAYREEIQMQIRKGHMQEYVEITGGLSREALRRAYRTARVYALFSTCESFGIPSVEAQRMGTPVVATCCCAAPEVCGKGGWYIDPGDVEKAACLLHRLLTDERDWHRLSRAAEENAARFEYSRTTPPLLDMLECK